MTERLVNRVQIDRSNGGTGPCAFPNDIELIEVGSDYLLGIASDSLDVPRVEVYRLDRLPA